MLSTSKYKVGFLGFDENTSRPQSEETSADALLTPQKGFYSLVNVCETALKVLFFVWFTEKRSVQEFCIFHRHSTEVPREQKTKKAKVSSWKSYAVSSCQWTWPAPIQEQRSGVSIASHFINLLEHRIMPWAEMILLLRWKIHFPPPVMSRSCFQSSLPGGQS